MEGFWIKLFSQIRNIEMAPVSPNRHPSGSEWLPRWQYCPKRCFSDHVFTWILSLKVSNNWENCFYRTVRCSCIFFFQMTQSYVSVCLLWTWHIPSYISLAATLKCVSVYDCHLIGKTLRCRELRQLAHVYSAENGQTGAKSPGPTKDIQELLNSLHEILMSF